MAFENSQSEGIQRPKKIRSTSATVEHGGHLEDFLAASKGQTTSSAPTINYYCSIREGLETLTSTTPTNNNHRGLREGLETLTSSTPTNNHWRGLREGLKTRNSSTPTKNHRRNLREGLEIQLVSTTSISFVSDSNIPEVIPSSKEIH